MQVALQLSLARETRLHALGDAQECAVGESLATAISLALSTSLLPFFFSHTYCISFFDFDERR